MVDEGATIPTSVILQVHTETADAEEVSELTAELRQDLINAGLGTSAIMMPGPSSHGNLNMERSVDPSLLDIVLISLTGANGLRAFVKAIEVFVKSRMCSISIRTPDGEVIEYAGPLSGSQREILMRRLAAQETRDEPAAPSAP